MTVKDVSHRSIGVVLIFFFSLLCIWSGIRSLATSKKGSGVVWLYNISDDKISRYAKNDKIVYLRDELRGES